jgi:hypothetical protein
VKRRQEALRTAGLLKAKHAASAQAGWELAATVIGKYLAAERNTPARAPRQSAGVTKVKKAPLPSRPRAAAFPAPKVDIDPASASDMELDSAPASELDSASEDNDSDADADAESDTFYPSKRARRIASFASISAPAANVNRSPKQRNVDPYPDPETQQLEKELATLEADADLLLLRRRKQELVAAFKVSMSATNADDSARNQSQTKLAGPLLQRLEREYTRCRASFLCFNYCSYAP